MELLSLFFLILAGLGNFLNPLKIDEIRVLLGQKYKTRKTRKSSACVFDN